MQSECLTYMQYASEVTPHHLLPLCCAIDIVNNDSTAITLPTLYS